MKKVNATILSLCLCCAPTAYALGPLDIDVTLAGWDADLSGDVRSGDDVIDVEDELGFESEVTGFVKARIDPPFIGILHFAYTPLSYTADGTIDGSKIYDGINFTADVDTELDLTSIDIGWTFSVIDAVVAEWELGVAVRMVEGRVEISDGTNTASEDLDFPIPMLKTVLRLDFPIVAAELDAAGLTFDGNRVVDVLAQLKVTPFPFLYIAAGYRQIEVVYEDDDDKVELDISGPFVGVGVDF